MNEHDPVDTVAYMQVYFALCNKNTSIQKYTGSIWSFREQGKFLCLWLLPIDQLLMDGILLCSNSPSLLKPSSSTKQRLLMHYAQVLPHFGLSSSSVVPASELLPCGGAPVSEYMPLRLAYLKDSIGLLGRMEGPCGHPVSLISPPSCCLVRVGWGCERRVKVFQFLWYPVVSILMLV